MNKIKLITAEDHAEAFDNIEDIDKKEWVTTLTNISYNVLHEEAIKAGWHCGACKIYAMIHNYTFLQKATREMPELTKAQIVDSFPFASD